MGETMSGDDAVFTFYRGEDSDTLRDVEQVELHGIPCIKGVSVSVHSEDWRTDLTMYVPITKVTHIIQYDSIEHYRKVLADYYAKRTSG